MSTCFEMIDAPSVALFEPPMQLRIGGLDLAIRELEDYLEPHYNVKLNAPLKELELVRPGLVHFHGAWRPDYLPVARWCTRRSIPYVISPHGMLEPWSFRHKRWKKAPYFYLLERQFLRGARKLLATSEQERINLKALTGHPDIAVIPLATAPNRSPNYAAARASLGWKQDEHVLLFLSRIHVKKGLYLLIEALKRVDLSGRTVRLAVVGDGESDYVQTLRTAAEKLSTKLKVEWAGPVWGEGKWQYLQGADLFCLPTYSENFGVAVLEAMQVGTPVLTTRATPWSFLADWGAGFITEPALDDVVAALERFFREFEWSASDRDRLAVRTLGQFSPDLISRRYLALYETLQNPSPTVN